MLGSPRLATGLGPLPFSHGYAASGLGRAKQVAAFEALPRLTPLISYGPTALNRAKRDARRAHHCARRAGILVMASHPKSRHN